MECLVTDESAEGYVTIRGILELWAFGNMGKFDLPHPYPRPMDSFVKVGRILRFNLTDGPTIEFHQMGRSIVEIPTLYLTLGLDNPFSSTSNLRVIPGVEEPHLDRPFSHVFLGL